MTQAAGQGPADAGPYAAESLRTGPFVIGPAKRFLRRRHRQFVFGRALRAFRRLAPGSLPRRDTLAALTYGWNNDGWSASPELMHEVLRCAWQANGPILECGSGLSTLLLGILADRTGTTIWSLEHDAFWAEHVQEALRAHCIRRVNIVHAPLRSFGDYSWYSAPADALPSGIALVVCDGPPGGTSGGRYGIVPVMRARLASGCVILLDDAARPDERAVVDRWERELESQPTVVNSSKPFARLVVP